MNEAFLHYIWQLQYFTKTNLQTTQGESLTIIKPGFYNTHAGPDFSQCKLIIDGIFWGGNIEVHIRASDWFVHKHDNDGAYESVVLHVVWKNDQLVCRKNGTPIPTLTLEDKVDLQLLRKYLRLINSALVIPCEKSFREVGEPFKINMLERSMMQRMETKADEFFQFWIRNNKDWDETAFQWLARNYGFKINAEPFLQLAKSISYKILQKHSDQLLQVEALLFGQAGMLEIRHSDEYMASLFREYQFLSKKYDIYDHRVEYHQWKFLRLRPANFPTVRIAQFASLMSCQKNLFSKIIEAKSYTDISALFLCRQSDYWQQHYRFGKTARARVPEIGYSSIHNLIINTISPFMVAYGKAHDDNYYIEKAIHFLQCIPGEQNKITRIWSDLGMSVKTAFDSQGVIEMYNHFCQKRQCLQCSIGTQLIKPSSEI